MTTLYLTEKGSQAEEVAEALGLFKKTNGVYRGDNVIVAHASGHLLEYAKPDAYGEQFESWTLDSLPCIPDNWKQLISTENRRHFETIKSVIGEATEVVIATDADREGEVIARSILDALRYRGALKRLWVQETTPSGYKKGFAKMKAGGEFYNLYRSGLGRSRADWLFGFNFTRGLTTAFSVGKGNVLHFGRVMTPTLTLVVLRERAIAKFVPSDYFNVSAIFDIAGEKVSLKLLAEESWLDNEGRLSNLTMMQEIVKIAESHQSYIVSKYETTQEQTKPPLPYYPATLYPECTKRFRLRPDKVDGILQKLYEAKLISYPRTEGEHIPEELFSESQTRLAALSKLDPSIKSLCDMADLDKPSHAFNDAKVAKEGSHFGIIPTDKDNFDLSNLSVEDLQVYDLIRRRYIAQFLGNYCFDKTVLELSQSNIRFGVTGNTPKVLGWKKAITEINDNDAIGDENNEQSRNLPVTTLNQRHDLVSVSAKSAKTKPPLRYDASSLVIAMENIHKEIEDPRLAAIMKNKEKAGIGTNATRGDTIKKLFDGGYFDEVKNKIIPTEKGTALIELLEKVCPELADPVLTAKWESALADVEKGELPLEIFEQKTAEAVHILLSRIRDAAGKITIGRIENPCPVCGKELIKRGSKKDGFWWGCSGYPTCKNTMQDANGKPVARQSKPANTNANATQYKCVQCGNNLVQRKGSKGAFWGCSGYPNCKATHEDNKGKPLFK